MTIVQKNKKLYLKNTNMFVLRQLNNKINTMVASMSVISLMLFMTISILSTSLALRNAMQKEIDQMTPIDLNLYKTANLPESYKTRNGEVIYYTKEKIEDSKITIKETLINNGLDMNVLKDVTEISIYSTNELTWKDFFANKLEEIKTEFSMLDYNTQENIIKISDYNKIAKLYKIQEYELNNNEYIMLCNFNSMLNLRNRVLNDDENKLIIAGKEYKSKYNECKDGYVEMSGSHVNLGIILVPDNCPLSDNLKERQILVANYNAKTDKEKEDIEKIFSDENSELIKNLDKNNLALDGITKIAIIDANVGIATIITFIAIYLGIIFLIASSAILALKQLTESTDNQQRYSVLRKIGCDEKMINKSLFRQIGIFFLAPLLLAIIHSIFGIQFALSTLEGFASKEALLPSITITALIIGAIYGAYFLATYYGSKNIIKE